MSATSTVERQVFVLDDHALVRESVTKLVSAEPGLALAGQSGRTDEALEIILRIKPDILVLDINCPGDGGVEVARRAREAVPGTRVIFLTMHDDDATVSRALAFADGYVLKTASIEELIQALRAVASGGSFLSPSIARQVLDRANRRGDAATLTARELEILQLLAEGKRPAEVATTLFVSLKTVRNHLASVYLKLGVASAAQAVTEAFRRGLVSAPTSH